MKIIPALTVKNGRVAVAESGQYSYLKNPEGQYRNPVNYVKEAELQGSELFVLDIDGLERNSPDLDTVKRLAAYREVWLDAGMADADDMMDLFVADASRVVMSTLFLQSLDVLKGALELSDDIIFSICYDCGTVSAAGELAGLSLKDLAGRLADMGVDAVILFDLGGIRDCRPLDMDAVNEIASMFREFYVSGHAAETQADALEAAGVTGIITEIRNIGGSDNEGT